MKLKRTIVLFVLLVCFAVSNSLGFPPERRRSQYPTQFGYFVAPLPYSVGGLGSGVAYAIAIGNMFNTEADLAGGISTGDVNGGSVVARTIPIYRNDIFDFYISGFYAYVSKAAVNVYGDQAMEDEDNTRNALGEKVDPKDNFTILEVGDSMFKGFWTELFFWEKRVKFEYKYDEDKLVPTAIRDNEGELVQEIDDASADTGKSQSIEAALYLTDDNDDPRTGFSVSYKQSLLDGETDEFNSSYYTIEKELKVYIPMLTYSTWVFDYYEANAIVEREGELDDTKIRERIGTTCDQSDADKRAICEETVNRRAESIRLKNQYGVGGSLGGRNYLRAFPQSRYSGPNVAFLGTEFRWNFSDGATPFDLFFVKDIRTTVQVAFFYEKGTVGVHKGDLWKNTRSSTGIGVRMLTGAGAVYRLDFATGEEGMNMNLIFNYPW